MPIQAYGNNLFTEWQGHAGPVVDVVAGREIIDCSVCGFRHVIPLPSIESLQETYATEYYRDEKPTYLTHASEDYEWSTLAFKDRLDIFESQLPPGRRKLLDVGSGPGLFLKYAADRAWDVHGVEPSAQAAQHTRDLGLAVTQTFFGPESAADLGTYDVVHMNNMLEHVPNPRELMSTAADLLADNGLICVCVPNDYNPLQEVLRENAGLAPWWVVPSHHLNYFNFDTLTGLIQTNGFEVIRQTTSFPMELFLLMGDRYVGDETLGRACHTKRKLFDMTLEQAGQGNLRRALYETFSKLGLGREAIVIGKKV